MLQIPLILALLATAVHAAPPSFQNTSAPAGWTLLKGEAEGSGVLQSKGDVPLELQTTEPVSLPTEAVIRFRATEGGKVAMQAKTAETGLPLLEATFKMDAGNQATVTAQSSGQAMATDTISTRTWTSLDKKTGQLIYRWRFPKIKNLWDDIDVREIGASYEKWTPFEEKVFALRMVIASDVRQIWLDDRLVAEDRSTSDQPARWFVQLTNPAKVLSVELAVPTAPRRFLPLALGHYSHSRKSEEAPGEPALVEIDSVPMKVPAKDVPDLDLGQSLYRYRLTSGSGPNASYVNGPSSWPNAFKVDPAVLSFRVPYRNYKNVWLLAWVDDKPNTVPKGSLRFFREDAGFPADTDWEITEDAIRQGLVKKLDRKTADGKTLYLVKVPVNTEGLYGMHDLASQFLEFELSKPVALARSYPDPIYYGYHAAGLPSSVHVVGITLEEAPFGFTVQPKQTNFVFEDPEKPEVTVTVTNTTGAPLKARVRATTVSHDGGENSEVEGQAVIEPGKPGDVVLAFDLKKFGWHGLKVEVEAEGTQRAAELSLLRLPPNTRTYGNAPNETRFGTWELLGHYSGLLAQDFEQNERLLALYRKLGLRRTSLHQSFVTADMLKRQDFLPAGPHTRWLNTKEGLRPDGSVDAVAMAAAVAVEVATVPPSTDFSDTLYFYGGEWGISEDAQYAPWPFYTGEGDRDLTAEEKEKTGPHVKMFTAVGEGMRAQRPDTKLVLQWGAPLGTLAYIRAGMPKDLVDLYGIDAPMFELLPELSNIPGSINQLWQVRQDTARLGWPHLPIAWCEGPFLPTNPGALTEDEQADYQVRYTLLGLAYGIEQFEAGVVPQDAGNYYGAEHYGAGIFHRRPLQNPKPAAAAFATTSAMVCGADVVGPVDTGCPTTYCLALKREKGGEMIYALWRVNGTSDMTLSVSGDHPVLTDSMGNPTPCPLTDGKITVKVSSSPVWLTGAGTISGLTLGPPHYDDAPAAITRPLPAFTAENWVYDGTEDKAYAHNHFATKRFADPDLKAEFVRGDDGHGDAVAVTLPVQPGDRPLATRYGQLKLKTPATIPGKAKALGVWIKGNSSWGRVIYQCRDAKGEKWTSVGAKESWNSDDTKALSYVSFEGWRYVRFPLPGNKPWDSARDLESTWWGSHGGDGIVDLPLKLEKIIVEARNEVPVLGEMQVLKNRTYELSGPVAEYETESDATEEAVARNKPRRPLPDWSGPEDNPIASLIAQGVGNPPAIREFVEPPHFNDGRNMLIRFDQAPSLVYNLYLSRFADGRGADLLLKDVKDSQLVTGLRPEMKMYFFLTATDAAKQESKPSPAFELTTHDNFAEK